MPKKNYEWYRTMPDGVVVKSKDEYLDWWLKWRKCVEELTGWRVYGFDPSFSIIKNGVTAQIPFELVRDLRLKVGDRID